MDQDFGTPIPPIEPAPVQPQKKNNTILIIVIVLVVLCCCCLMVAAAGYLFYQNGDKWFNIPYTLLPILTV
jgi:uncharacterized membrane protein YkvI